MANPLIPDEVIGSVYELTPERLRAAGKRLILADLDNTLARYREQDPSEALLQWRQGLLREGVRVFILSNGRKPNRTRRFARGLGVEYINHAGKPKAEAFRWALDQACCVEGEALMVGDQIFTDIWGAHNAGLTAVLVKPVALDNWFRRLRYWVETPFRSRCPQSKEER